MSRRPEIVLLVLAVAAVLVSGGWFIFFAAPFDEPGAERQVASAVARPGGIRKPNTWEPRLLSWGAPSAQSRSARWVYDVFTPPEIFYDAALQQFTVSPPTTDLRSETETTADSREIPELRLIGVKRPLFRLQLIGFVKSAGQDIGLFENVTTSEIFLARKGKPLPELRLEIEELEVRPSPMALPESMTTRQTLAQAVVRDQYTGESIILSSTERRLSSYSQATLMERAVPGHQHEVSEGDVFDVGEVRYEVGEISVSPPTVALIRRSSADGVVERRILRVVEGDSSNAVPPSI